MTAGLRAPTGAERKDGLMDRFNMTGKVGAGITTDSTPGATIRVWSLGRPEEYPPLTLDMPEGDEAAFWVDWARCVAHGLVPSREVVRQLASILGSLYETDFLLSQVADLALPAVPGDLLDAQARARRLIAADVTPNDRAPLINAALVLEYGAIHLEPMVARGRLLSLAAACWWCSGDVYLAVRNIRTASVLSPKYPWVSEMRSVLEPRTMPAWL